MKKLLSICICALIIALSGVFSVDNYKTVKAESTTMPDKHLILNSDQSYGGSVNESLYGKGAPKNGEFDVANSPYFTVNDYYNMLSTTGDYPLTILPNFKPYQQTMKNSSAFACLVMAFNRLGLDVTGEYSELSLYQKYEQLNGVTLKDADVKSADLRDFIKSLNLGYELESKPFPSGNTKNSSDLFRSFVERNLNEGNYVLVRYQSQADFGWKIIIGVDGLDTDFYYDDVLILANPFDVSDHYQDGFSLQRLGSFTVWWQQVTENGEKSLSDECVVIKSGVRNNFTRVARSTEIKQTAYDLHLMLNADGSYGGTRNKDKYGAITTKNGSNNHLNTNYYKTNDYYNMGDEGSRLLLKNYNTFQQTMASSCGICSMMSVFNYLGESVDESWEVTLTESYERLNRTNILKKGTSAKGNLKVAEELGYKGYVGGSNTGEEPAFPTYESYRDFIKENLQKDQPIAISARPQGGHWIVIIGLDDMGTPNIYDDVIITADSSDTWDHYQDGYNTYSATHLYRTHFSGHLDKCYSYLIIKKPFPVWAIVLIAVGGVAVLTGGTFAVITIIKKKKSKKQSV
ncbi:MAG: hypothetical protein IKA54_01330 [Clostridia bacterium]|nr:hypothetical protein [Clostridia bacterium]